MLVGFTNARRGDRTRRVAASQRKSQPQLPRGDTVPVGDSQNPRCDVTRSFERKGRLHGHLHGDLAGLGTEGFLGIGVAPVATALHHHLTI